MGQLFWLHTYFSESIVNGRVCINDNCYLFTSSEMITFVSVKYIL